MNRTIARLSAALFSAALIGIAAPASAHVTVSSPDAEQGGFGKAVFRVPTESDTASTSKLVITLPQDTPFAFVNAGVKPGWKVTIDKSKLDQPTKVGDFELTEAVRTITWTSTGEGIPPSQFDEFAISAGPFPGVSTLSFSAEQTYSDGEVVHWDETSKAGQEAEHPAPTLTLGRVDAADHSAAADNDGSDAGTWLGGAALVLGAGALVVALRQNRRRA